MTASISRVQAVVRETTAKHLIRNVNYNRNSSAPRRFTEAMTRLLRKWMRARANQTGLCFVPPASGASGGWRKSSAGYSENGNDVRLLGLVDPRRVSGRDGARDDDVLSPRRGRRVRVR